MDKNKLLAANQLTKIQNGFGTTKYLILSKIIDGCVSLDDAKLIIKSFLATCSLGQDLYCHKYGGNGCPDCPVRDVCCNIDHNPNKLHFLMAKIITILQSYIDAGKSKIRDKELSLLVKQIPQAKITHNNLSTEINKLKVG